MTIFDRNRRSLMYLYRHYAQRNFLLLTTIFTCSFIVFSAILYSNIHSILYVYRFLHLPGHSYIPLNSPTKTISYQQNFRKSRGLTVYDQRIKYLEFNYLQADTLTYENRTYQNSNEILYRLPKNKPASALLLIFHGCGRSAHDWFHTIERQRIIGAAIDLGYVCLAFQAADDFSKCWSNDNDMDNNLDIQRVLKGLEEFYKEYPKLGTLPRFTFGSSSGGIFSSVFVTNRRYPIQGQILFISIILPEILEKNVKKNSYPPTAWIYMSRDTEFASEERINASVEVFIREHIPHKTFDIEPIRVMPTTFHDRIPTIHRDTSHFIFRLFQKNNWLDSENFFIHNPRRVHTWKDILFASKNNQLDTAEYFKNLNENKKIIPDFLNTIYGEHEISFERSYEALRWLLLLYRKKIDS